MSNHENQNQFAPLASIPSNEPGSSSAPGPEQRRRKGRGGKKSQKKRARRKSFALLAADSHDEGGPPSSNGLGVSRQQTFYSVGRNLSNTSLDSGALLDHRDSQPLRPRRASTMAHSFRPKRDQSGLNSDTDPERVPLLPSPVLKRSESGYTMGGYGSAVARQASRGSSESSRTRAKSGIEGYNVNYPPSVPGSPTLGPTDGGLDMSFGDVMIRDELARAGGESPRHMSLEEGERLGEDGREMPPAGLVRRGTMARLSEEDRFFPETSEIAEDEARSQASRADSHFRRRRRRRRAPWPDLAVLEERSRLEMEQRTFEGRAKKITEPQLINGRLRPVNKGWYRSEEDAPYRFTYFNEEAQSTIHSQTISELTLAGGSFKDLFLPERRILSDESSGSEADVDDAEDLTPFAANLRHGSFARDGESFKVGTPARNTSSMGTTQVESEQQAKSALSPRQKGPSPPLSPKDTSTGVLSPNLSRQPRSSSMLRTEPKQPQYGDRPVWWLDVLCPSEAEMKVLSQAFGIHPLTAEDIMVQEDREKVELFRNYYFVTYRTFDQDDSCDNFMEPVNMYAVVFREGVITFHFSMTPHPANVRRRIRQLKDYLIVSADWISYAIIDDITDAFVPLMKSIEQEADDIDEAILKLHSVSAKKAKGEMDEKHPDDGATEDLSELLSRVGDCRRRVMNVYRLLGNKADVIKGFAKKCNERWEIAPRSEIGLYLGDIQDHIVTMTSNLSHYEKILARSHANCLAQVNLKMNERSEKTADGLNQLTILGTIVLPMNIITGLWGMNVWVPGQEYEGNLLWFFGITTFLLAFGFICYFIAKRMI